MSLEYILPRPGQNFKIFRQNSRFFFSIFSQISIFRDQWWNSRIFSRSCKIPKLAMVKCNLLNIIIISIVKVVILHTFFVPLSSNENFHYKGIMCISILCLYLIVKPIHIIYLCTWAFGLFGRHRRQFFNKRWFMTRTHTVVCC